MSGRHGIIKGKFKIPRFISRYRYNPNSTPPENRSGPYNTSNIFCAPVVHRPEKIKVSPLAAESAIRCNGNLSPSNYIEFYPVR